MIIKRRRRLRTRKILYSCSKYPNYHYTLCNLKLLVADPCEDYTCRRVGSVCRAAYPGADGMPGGGRPVCRCPSCRYEPREPLCGLHGNREVTAPNLCMLKRAACLSNDAYEILHPGSCNSKYRREGVSVPHPILFCTMR